MPTDAVAQCRSLVRTYTTASGRVDALKGVDIDIERAAITAVVGPSGSGKSSLLRILAGLDRPTNGSALVGETDVGAARPRGLRALRRNVGYVFQRPSDNLISYLTLSEHLQMSARLRGVAPPEPAEILEPLGLAHRADHRPSELSGGEQQRAAFAQAIVGDPLLVVADEPTAELDSETAAGLLEVVSGLPERGLTVVMATHDAAAMQIAGSTILLHHGEVQTR